MDGGGAGSGEEGESNSLSVISVVFEGGTATTVLQLRYGDSGTATAVRRQRYGDSGTATAVRQQRYGDSGTATAVRQQRYGNSGTATAVRRQRYGDSGTATALFHGGVLMSSQRYGRQLRLLCMPLFAIACGPATSDNPPVSAPARRDSAGIEIVENLLSEPRRTAGWTVSSNADVDIGVREGAVEYMLNRVAGAVRFSDGRIFIGHDRAEWRIYTATGQHGETKSIVGLGPEELQTLYAVMPYRGDSVLLRGGGPGTGMEAMILDSKGTFGRKFQIGNVDAERDAQPNVRTLTGKSIGLQGVAGDGSLVIRGSARVRLRGESGPLWGNSPHFLVDATGKVADTLATLRVYDLEEGKDGSGTGALSYGIPLFDRGGVVAAISGKWMFHGDADQFEILAFRLSKAVSPDVQLASTPVSTSTNGESQPARIIRYALPNRPVGPTERNLLIETLLESARNAADTIENRKFYENMAIRPSFPAFTGLIADTEGNLWVEHPRIRAMSGRPEDRSELQLWTVFDSTGALIGDVSTPPALKIFQIGRDFILGLWSDEDGVEHVRVHQIRKR